MARDELDDTGDDRAAQGLAHLQAAARELIAAARAVLDVAEDLVDDPKAVSAMVETMGTVVGKAVRSATAGGGNDDGDADAGGGYQRIRLG